jgi:hypothetical protein
MTQIVLKNQINESNLDTLLSVLTSWNVNVEIDTTAAAKKKPQKKTSLTLSVGMWEGRNIDSRELRRRASGIDKRLGLTDK